MRERTDFLFIPVGLHTDLFIPYGGPARCTEFAKDDATWLNGLPSWLAIREIYGDCNHVRHEYARPTSPRQGELNGRIALGEEEVPEKARPEVAGRFREALQTAL